MKPDPESESQPVESLGRVLDVLELFTAQEPELTLTAVAERLGWPTPTAHRVVNTLLARRFLTREPASKRLRLGTSVMRLVAPLISGLSLPDIAQPHLHRLASEMGETVNLAVLDGGDTLYIASAAGGSLLRAETPPGLRIPAHCTALGKCMLAQLEPADARGRLGPGPYEARTAYSLRSWAQLEPQLDSVRGNGYALSLEEYEVGLNSCAVGVPTTDRTPAAINVAAVASRVPPDELVARFVPRLRSTAEAIARAQGISADGQ